MRRIFRLNAARDAAEGPSYDGMDRDALTALARSRGILVGGRWKVPTIIRKLRETDRGQA